MKYDLFNRIMHKKDISELFPNPKTICHDYF